MKEKVLPNPLFLISLVITLAAPWWILICKKGTLYHLVWALFIISCVVAWTVCIKAFCKSYRAQNRLKAFSISLLFDVVICHTASGIMGILISSDEGPWHIRDIVEGVPFWLYLISITYPFLMAGIYIKEKKFAKGIFFIVLGIAAIVAGWMLLGVWARGEIGVA